MDNNKPAVFYFMFSLQNEKPWVAGEVNEEEDEDSPTVFYGFNITLQGVNNYLAKVGGDNFDDVLMDDDSFSSFVTVTEGVYGIHDWSSSPCDECYGVGYSTYEVPSKNINELMNKWRDYFIGLVGNEVSDVVQFFEGEDEDVGGSDWDYSQAITQKLESLK